MISRETSAHPVFVMAHGPKDDLVEEIYRAGGQPTSIPWGSPVDAGVVVVDCRGFEDSDDVARAVKHVPRSTTVLVGTTHAHNLAPLLAPRGVRHISSGPQRTGELATLLRHLLHQTQPTASELLGDDAQWWATEVSSSRQRDEIAAILASRTRSWNVNPRIGQCAVAVADEFLTNAVYNAPIYDGHRPYAARDRRQEVRLEAHERAQFVLGFDDDRLVIAATDPFGSLSIATMRNYLLRCFAGGETQIAYKAGGAGLGFYTVVASTHKLFVCVRPRVSTELIAVLHVRGSFRQFAAQPKAIHLFKPLH